MFAISWRKSALSNRLPKPSLRYSEQATRYQHLQKLPVKDYEAVTPGILIGAEYAHMTKQLCEGIRWPGEPVTARTQLGWVVYGPVQKGMQNSSFKKKRNVPDPFSSKQPEESEKDLRQGLLWRYDNVEFLGSYQMAVRRLQCFV